MNDQQQRTSTGRKRLIAGAVAAILLATISLGVGVVEARQYAAECAASGPDRLAAMDVYEQSCEAPRIDCDRIDGIWYCSSRVIGSNAPGGVTSSDVGQSAIGVASPDVVVVTLPPKPNTTTTTTPTTTKAPTTKAPTTTQAPTTTEAPTTTKAPTTTEAPTTTQAPTTTEAPTTTKAPTTTTTEPPAAPATNPGVADHTRIVSIRDYGVRPGGGDKADEINDAIGRAERDGVSLRFEPGDYAVGGDIRLRDGVGLYGSDRGFTRLIGSGSAREIAIGTQGSARSVAIDGFVFDNLHVSIRGGEGRNAQITNNLFTDVRAERQISIARGEDVLVAGNVFIRNAVNQGNSQYGDSDGMNAWKSEGVVIRGNVFGGLTDGVARTSALSPAMVDRLDAYIDAYDEYDLWDGGYYSKAIDGTETVDLDIVGNTFWGVPDGDFARDHVVYLKAYQDAVVAENYFSGWPKDSRGGLKIRNAAGPIVISNNHFDNVPILSYVLGRHVSINEELRRTYIVGNTFDRDYANGWAPLMFWNKTSSGRVQDFVAYANTFDTDGRDDLDLQPGPGDRGRELMVAGNTFDDGRADGRHGGDHMTDSLPGDIKARLDDYDRIHRTPTPGRAELDRNGKTR
ncbi:MAG: hypothetical protein AAF547_04045 [Actinomycetota bacterium]